MATRKKCRVPLPDLSVTVALMKVREFATIDSDAGARWKMISEPELMRTIQLKETDGPDGPVLEMVIDPELVKAVELEQQANARAGSVEYPFTSRTLLANPTLLHSPRWAAIALKIVAAYAAEHPVPQPNGTQITDAVDYKTLIGGPPLAYERGITIDEAREVLLPRARQEVAKEVGTSHGAVKTAHTRVRRKRVKQRPR
jgi:hypothetical protein